MAQNLLIKQAVAGNREALAKLIDAYKDIAFNIALSVVRNREDAKDIVQESLVKVVVYIDRFREESAFSTWLYRIVYNESMRHVGQLSKRAGIDARELAWTFYREDDAQLADARYIEVMKQIDKLSERERQVVILFYLAEKSIKEISDITQMSISNIKVNLHRIRRKLSENLGTAI
ncbi:MAG TPA: sigma-70 family RNA polymerase sigma factor [Chryseolinea sp.]|nr:sigma-70 family RNA polymerase sigma factor [Chryseolinea sp.]